MVRKLKYLVVVFLSLALSTIGQAPSYNGGPGTGTGSGVGTLFASSAQASTVTTTTLYFPLTGNGTGNSAEYPDSIVVPSTCTAQNLYVVTNSTNGAGTLTIKLRYGTTFPGMADTSIVVTVGSGASAGTFSDTTHTQAVAAGGIIDLSAVMSAATSGQIIGFGLQCK